MKRLEHNVGTLSKVKIATVPHDAVRAISEKYPHLTRILWFSTLLDAAINRESILSVGRRTALARVAHLLCEVKARLDLVDLVKDGRYQFPLTQADIADATGLTSVHVNRMLKKLRDDKILTFRGGEVVLHDWGKLQRIAEFDPAISLSRAAADVILQTLAKTANCSRSDRPAQSAISENARYFNAITVWHDPCSSVGMAPDGRCRDTRGMKMTYVSLQQFALSVVGAVVASSLFVSAAIGSLSQFV